MFIDFAGATSSTNSTAFSIIKQSIGASRQELAQEQLSGEHARPST
jgi:hypothetical protein